jgi:hypothetical protein
MKYAIVIPFVLAASSVYGQLTVGKIDDLSFPSIDYPSLTQHFSIQPAVRVYEYKLADGIEKGAEAYPVRVDTYHRIRFNPDFAAQYDTSLFHRSAAGISAEVLYRDKFYTRAALSVGWSTREGLNQVHPAFTPQHDRNEFIYVSLRSRICYTPNRFLHVAGGTDNQFFGEGYRSLIQSDQASPNPFALMRATVWRLEYGLLYQLFHENAGGTRRFKFGATHYLSYNITKKWNVGVFETVFFQPKDGPFNRAVEVEYLNPLVFFRPQEYSLGSSDNVLIAFQTSYTLRTHVLYGQLLLDEFVLKEIRGRSKWWANKYGVQIGIKGKPLHFPAYRIEANLMRPYTYAHINDGQNGGNQGRPLAHPLGSNFVELLAQLETKLTGKVLLKPYAVFQLQGFDQDSVSMGGDIYQSYLTHPKEYGNTIGQGITQRNVRIGCELQYEWTQLNSLLYIDPQAAYSWGEHGDIFTPAITLGWRSCLFQDRKQF